MIKNINKFYKVIATDMKTKRIKLRNRKSCVFILEKKYFKTFLFYFFENTNNILILIFNYFFMRERNTKRVLMHLTVSIGMPNSKGNLYDRVHKNKLE